MSKTSLTLHSFAKRARERKKDALEDDGRQEQRVRIVVAAHRRVKNSEGQIRGKMARAALRNHDIYVLVMVDQAGIPRPKP